MTANNIHQSSILVDVQGRQVNAEPGSLHERFITVQNRDSKPTDLFLWLTAPKGKDQEILRWYNLEVDAVSKIRDKDEISLKLQPGESTRIDLSFQIPFAAEPGTYHYEVCVRSSIYSEPICRHQQLTIPYSEHYWKYGTEPEFSITPISSSENPQVVKAGESLTFDITVKNRSNSVDNFTVVLPELSEEDFNCCPNYQEGNSEGNSVDGLRLNPGDKGVIKLLLQPKSNLSPGQYFSTLRLKSQKSKSTVLGIIYLNIPVNDSLTIDFSPPSRKIPSPTTSFELKIHNNGNIRRHISFAAKDDENLFKYRFEPDNLLLEPSLDEKAVVILTPKPNTTSFGKRSWKGEEIQVPFQVCINNVTKLDTSLYLPDSPCGLIVWKPHPSLYNWFLNRLNTILFLLLFLALGYVGVILVRELIWKYIVQPSLQPKVIEFVTTEKSYQAGQGDGIRLNWEIKNLKQLGKVELFGVKNENEIKVLTPPQLFVSKDDKGNIEIVNKPNGYNTNNIENSFFVKQLKQLPLVQQSVSSQNTGCDNLNINNFVYCKFVKSLQDNFTSKFVKPLQDNFVSPMFSMTAKESEQKQKYTVNIPRQFEQQIEVNGEVVTESRENDFCKLKTVPPNQSPLHYFWKVIYNYQPEMQGYKDYETQVIRCSNMLAVRFDRNSSNTILSQNAQPQKTQQSVQKKRPKDEGNYEFEIKLYTEGNPDIVSASRAIKDIKVIPAPPEPPLPQPEIQVFAPILPVYRQSDIANTSNKNNKTQDILSQQLPKSPVKVNWVIANPKNISHLEMNIAFVGLDGKTQSTPTITYSFLLPNKSTKTSEIFTWQIPPKLPCRLIDTDRLLVCQNLPVPINTNLAGQYKLTLTAFPIPGKRAKDLKSVIKTIEAITIKPSLPQIQSFKVNGLDVLTNPNQIFTFEQGKNPPDVDISWQVKNPQQMNVELLPAPGLLPLSTHEMKYKLSPNPGSTPITLKVTNQVGESITQTVMLQTVANVQPQIKPGTVPLLPPPPPPVDGARPSSNIPLNPEDLPPFELPPKTN